ncbi:MAG: inorganic phosphate transporter, partial [Promethearchaeota archaeon]
MDTIVIILLILMMGLAFAIGANDETMATLVGTRSVKVKTAVIIGAFLVFFGVYFLSAGVGKTVGASLLGKDVEYNVNMMLAILISTIVWLVVASQTGAPISTTHSLVGSVFGIGVVWAIQGGDSFFKALNWSKMGSVALGWVISPILGFTGAYLFQMLVNWFIHKQKIGLDKLELNEKSFLYLLFGAVCW